MTGLLPGRFIPESYILNHPLSPHRASELDHVVIDLNKLRIYPQGERPIIIELAGGLMVPITRTLLQVDLIADWHMPIILCARTTLGTINHTLLSCEAIRRRNLPLLGVVFIGDENEDTQRTIIDFANAKTLGRVPTMARLDAKTLNETFEREFNRDDFIRPVVAR
jgi:dethiobiotin synthetase